ncbi:MAG TPA: dehypoxanthine futalosine cyclase, partial [Verrucomicrobiota bacterium]|nr:dehypoxanthine futalosine cyclase [Verrucomicrobiota bacterium]
MNDYIPRVGLDATKEALCQKTWDGGRVSADEAVQLYELPLPQLGALADRRRRLAKADAYGGRGNDIVTYNIDRNINYTNVCD